MTEPEIQQQKRPRMTVEKLVYGGEGLARWDGRVLLAPYVLPGEVIEADLAGVRGNPALVRAVDVIESAPERIAPGCPYFTTCGGCHLQHGPYEFQLAQKKEMLRETLRRIGKIESPEDIRVVAAEQWGYRNRSQFHVAQKRIGYLAARSHSLIPVTHCPISSPKVNDALAKLRDMARDRRFPDFIRSIEIFTNEEQTQLNVLDTQRPVAKSFFEWAQKEIGGSVSGPIEYPTAQAAYRVGYKSFFQVNRFLVDSLVAESLPAEGGQTALDLYSGVGLFSLPLARKFAKVTAIESSASAIRDLEFNAARAQLSVQAVHGSVDDYLKQLTEAPDFVLADPPRAGLDKKAVTELIRLSPQRLVIVACEPPTLARDLSKLLGAGYSLDSLTIVDLFPQTYHFEVVAKLSR